MKKLNYVFIAVIVLSLSLFQSCNDDTEDTTARVQLKLIDAPGDYLEVNVEIVDIQYNTSDDAGWTQFTPEDGYPINVDLTELIAGNSLLLTDEIIPAGMLHQIRLVLSDNNTLKIEGEEELIPLRTPSAMQSGLKLNLNEELEPGFSYTFVLDWIVQESIVKAGNSGNYNLKPVIRVNTEVNSGAIRGTVVESVEDALVPIENVTVGVFTLDDVLVTDTLTDENGVLMLQGLEGGTYKIKISHEGYEDYESDEIVVQVGEVEDIGTIEMIKI